MSIPRPIRSVDTSSLFAPFLKVLHQHTAAVSLYTQLHACYGNPAGQASIEGYIVTYMPATACVHLQLV